MNAERKIQASYDGAGPHWVGDGFRVLNYFPSGNRLERALSPFLLMDYHPPYSYSPTTHVRGVGPHPHRGFETVTLAWEGSVAHHDSVGNAGVIGPGDVQWMTAGAGILHKEYHEENFARRGGPMHMMQLWVNLPKAHKMTPPKYQALLSRDMGVVEVEKDGGVVRVIAGEHRGVRGPASTFSPINLWDIRLNAQGAMTLDVPAGHGAGLFVMEGEIEINRANRTQAGKLVVFGNEGRDIRIEATAPSHALLLSGETIHEPIAHYGPFVMNTEEELRQAVLDFNAGKFGTLS